MKINFNKVFKTKLLYESYSLKHDDYGYGDKDEYKFGFYIRILKQYTLKGVFYRIEVPNLSDCDKNLFRLIDRVANYIHDRGVRYLRLKDRLMDQGEWKELY